MNIHILYVLANNRDIMDSIKQAKMYIKHLIPDRIRLGVIYMRTQDVKAVVDILNFAQDRICSRELTLSRVAFFHANYECFSLKHSSPVVLNDPVICDNYRCPKIREVTFTKMIGINLLACINGTICTDPLLLVFLYAYVCPSLNSFLRSLK